MAAVLIAVALYVVENYGGNGFVPSWDQIYQWVGLEPSQSETTAPLPEGETEVVFLDVGQGDAVLILQNECWQTMVTHHVVKRHSLLVTNFFMKWIGMVPKVKT